MSATSIFPPRRRVIYLAGCLAVIVAGLAWRAMPLPAWLGKYGGDALWALMVFVGLGVLLTRISTWRLALLALAISWGIEFSQLYHTPWFDALRATRVGHLVFGSTFNAPDLIAYVFGVVIGAVLEIFFRKR